MTMTLHEIERDFSRARKRQAELKQLFDAVSARRDSRSHIIEPPAALAAIFGGDRAVPQWVIDELLAMTEGVNVLRAEAGIAPAGVEEVGRVEIHARGHCDYASKFVLYCSWLAEGRSLEFILS